MAERHSVYLGPHQTRLRARPARRYRVFGWGAGRCEEFNFMLGSVASPVLTNLELNAVWSDYFKHLTTLSTGAVVLIATFLEKFAPHPHWRPAVFVSLIGFLVAVLGSLAAMTSFAMEANETGKESVWKGALGGVGIVAAWSGFVVGVSALTLFALNNLPV